MNLDRLILFSLKQVVGTPRLHLSAFVNRPIVDVDSGGEVRHFLTRDSDSGV